MREVYQNDTYSVRVEAVTPGKVVVEVWHREKGYPAYRTGGSTNPDRRRWWSGRDHWDLKWSQSAKYQTIQEAILEGIATAGRLERERLARMALEASAVQEAKALVEVEHIMGEVEAEMSASTPEGDT